MEIQESRPVDYRWHILMMTSPLLNLISGHAVLVSSILILFSFMFPLHLTSLLQNHLPPLTCSELSGKCDHNVTVIYSQCSSAAIPSLATNEIYSPFQDLFADL